MMSRYRTARALMLLLALGFAVTRPATVLAEGWELEVHAGLGLPTNPTAGTGSVPGTGSASAPAVPSWYFGDGAMALNQALTSFGLNGHLASIDSALTSRFFKRADGAVLGARLDHALTGRFSAEFSIDDSLGPLQANSASRAEIDAAGASFTGAWNAILAAPARAAQTVTSVDSFTRDGRQLLATGGLVIDLTHRTRVQPFATIGGGVAVDYGSSPSAQLTGSYQFAVAPAPGTTSASPATFHETDAVTVSTSTNAGAVGLFGAGARVGNGRWRLRIDARDYLRRNTATTIVTSAPNAQISQSGAVFVLGFSPPLVFSTVSGTPSTLSTPLSNVTTFHATGVQHELAITVGLSWRF
jgi:hypothetical protein